MLNGAAAREGLDLDDVETDEDEADEEELEGELDDLLDGDGEFVSDDSDNDRLSESEVRSSLTYDHFHP